MGSFFKFGGGGFGKRAPIRFELVGGGGAGGGAGAGNGDGGGTGGGAGAGNADERVMLRLAPAEIKLLWFFSEKLSDDLLDTRNPRLYPEAHRDNPRLQEEFDELIGQELQTSRQNTLGVLADFSSAVATTAAGDHQLLTVEQLDQWVAALNVLHLALGSRLENKGITLGDPESIMEYFSGEGERTGGKGESDTESDRLEIAAYFLMSDMLEEASQFMLDQLA